MAVVGTPLASVNKSTVAQTTLREAVSGFFGIVGCLAVKVAELNSHKP